MGEHSNPEEPWRTTAARALREELGLGVADDDAGLVNLAPGTSYLVKVAYDDVARRDLHADRARDAVGRRFRALAVAAVAARRIRPRVLLLCRAAQARVVLRTQARRARADRARDAVVRFGRCPRSAASHISMCEAAALGATARSSELAVAPPGRLGTRPRTASSPLTESRPRGRGRQATLHRPLQYPGESRLLS